MAKRKPELKPANPMPTTEQYMQRDREAFASATAAAIRTFKDEPRAFKMDREENRVSIAERVILIWSEFERIEKEKTGETINGASNKTEWAKKHKITLRYCEYIIKGKRDRSAEVKTRAMNLQTGLLVKVGDQKFPLTDQMIAALIGLNTNHVVRVEPKKAGRGKKEETAPTKDSLAVHYRAGQSQYAACHKPVGSKYNNPTTKLWDKVTCDACLAKKPEPLAATPPTVPIGVKMPRGNGDAGVKTAPEQQPEIHMAKNRRRTVCGKPMGDVDLRRWSGKTPTCVVCHKEYRSKYVRSNFVHAIKAEMGLLATAGDPMGTVEKRMTKEQSAQYDALVFRAQNDPTVQGWFSGDVACDSKQVRAWVEENLKRIDDAVPTEELSEPAKSLSATMIAVGRDAREYNERMKDCNLDGDDGTVCPEDSIE
jgi:hypothetical protein